MPIFVVSDVHVTRIAAPLPLFRANLKEISFHMVQWNANSISKGWHTLFRCLLDACSASVFLEWFERPLRDDWPLLVAFFSDSFLDASKLRLPLHIHINLDSLLKGEFFSFKFTFVCAWFGRAIVGLFVSRTGLTLMPFWGWLSMSAPWMLSIWLKGQDKTS